MKRTLPACFLAAALLASVPLSRAVEPVVSFNFNTGEGTSAYGDNSKPAELRMVGADRKPANLFSAPATGVTGKPGDFALDIAKTTEAMGVAGKTGGLATVSPGANMVGAAASLTLTGWLMPYSQPNGAARIIEYNDPLQAGFCLYAGGPGFLTLSLNKKQVSTPRDALPFPTETQNKWVFFAVTYDSTKSGQNVVFYTGSPTSEPQELTSASLDGGKLTPLNHYGALNIGNNGGGIRPFHGLMDNIAIYASDTDGSGTLGLDQIKAIYKAALTNAPAAAQRPIKIALVGDSTVCEYPDSSLLRGWGQMLREFTTPGAIYDNQAQGGKSSKNFPPERWSKILAEKPDFVFIQFGANDAHGPGAPESTDAATDYKENLRRYVKEARAASIMPVLVTPPHRRLFNAGQLTQELAPYAEAMKAVGEELKVPVVDLYEESGKWMASLGEEKSTPVTVNRGPDPAKDDRSHYTKEGATTLARFVSQTFPKVDPRLAKVLKAQ